MPRLTIKYYLSIFLITLIMSYFTKIQAMTIEYFSLSPEKFISDSYNNLYIKICEIGNVDDQLQAINNDLQEKNAIQPVTNVEIAQIYSTQFQNISQKLQCDFEAANLGITQLPAIVLDHRYVIYGQQNIDMAAQEYQAYLERQHV